MNTKQEQERRVHEIMSGGLFNILENIIEWFDIDKADVTQEDMIRMAIAMTDLETVMHRIINRKQK
jgi:hypothetical protein